MWYLSSDRHLWLIPSHLASWVRLIFGSEHAQALHLMQRQRLRWHRHFRGIWLAEVNVLHAKSGPSFCFGARLQNLEGEKLVPERAVRLIEYRACCLFSPHARAIHASCERRFAANVVELGTCFHQVDLRCETRSSCII